jgi:metal-responsive CopG/Arc/MetJ family transcriptional regulator
MTEKIICGIALPLDLARRARLWASLENKSRSQIVREALEEFLGKKEAVLSKMETPQEVRSERVQP